MKFQLSCKIYPFEAVLNASYTFIDRVYIFLDSNLKEDKVIVSFKEKQKLSPKKLEDLRGEFMNELLHCVLRYKISKNNKKIREYIVGRALYSALPLPMEEALLGEDSGKLDYQEDPLGITIPWEEKHGKKKNAKSEV